MIEMCVGVCVFRCLPAPVFCADARLLMSLTAFGVNDVRSRASARKTGAGIWCRI